MLAIVSHFRLRVACLAGVAVGGALFCSAPGSLAVGATAPHVRNGLIAFDQIQGNMLVMRPDGSRRRLLARRATEPTFTPDGQKIAFAAASGGLAIMNADGSHRHAIPNTDFGRAAPSEFPSFSPDGSQIVFDNGGRMYAVNVDGSNLRQLSNHEAIWAVFTPDGKRIVFDDGTLHEIASIGLDGTNERRVPGTNSKDTCPCSFSPNGQRIVFAHAPGPRSEFISIINVDGTHRHQLSHPPSNRVDVSPAFSPDGTLIVFNRTGFGEGDIVVMHATGAHVRTLAAHKPGYGDPAWQPLH